MRPIRSRRKIAKSYTLSPASIAVIEEEKKVCGFRSASAALDALLTDRARQSHVADIAASVSNRIETEREEDGRWIAEINEIPGVLAYGKTERQAKAKAYALALRVVAGYQ
jgi:hypothetical protein